jgi:hypothetical protein
MGKYAHISKEVTSFDPRKFTYSLRHIILFANIDVSKHILVIDTSILVKSNMGRREYMTSQTGVGVFAKQRSCATIRFPLTTRFQSLIRKLPFSQNNLVGFQLLEYKYIT